MKSEIMQRVTVGEVIDKVEAKLGEIGLTEQAMTLTQQELAVIKGRIEISWQIINLRVAEVRALVADLKMFVAPGPNGGSE